MFGGLLIGIRQLDQLRFRPGPTVECDTHRERAAARVTHGHIDCRKAGGWGEDLAIVSGRCIQISDQPGWIAPRGIDKGVQLQPVHRLRHGLAELFAIGAVGPACFRIQV